jgi:cephalosporin-C deacetylase
VDVAFETLDHVDAVHLATRASAPALVSVALRDDICPPSTVFSAFNHYGGEASEAVDKEIRVWAANKHEGGGAHQQREQLAWLAARVPPPGRSSGQDDVRRSPAGPEDPPATAEEVLNPA